MPQAELPSVSRQRDFQWHALTRRDRGESTHAGDATPTDDGGGNSFVSYVGVHADIDADAPDGLDHEMRMALEEKAIRVILQYEPELQRTPTHNPGFDLYEPGEDGEPLRWIEVKAMSGSLKDRPVGLSLAICATTLIV